MDQLLTAYQKHLQEALRPDATQDHAVRRLATLSAELAHRPKGWRRLAARLARRKGPAPINGFYLYGGVGRGKTMVMDMFYNHAPITPKRRVHFHAFMLEVHEYLHRLRQSRGAAEKPGMPMDDALMACADHIATTSRLLCLDEFQVRDVADAMILARLFTALFARGVSVVMTGNIAPDDLYKDGLQRDRFLPFIALLRQKLEVIAFDGATDYRLRRLQGQPVCFWPHDTDAQKELERIFAALTDGAAGEEVVLDVKGHSFRIPRAGRDVAMFHFDDICGVAAGAVDYLALAEDYRFVIVADVPALDDRRRDIALRFITLIDALYDRHRHIALSAAAAPDKLYKGAFLQVAYDRAASRLAEMQSQHYRES